MNGMTYIPDVAIENAKQLTGDGFRMFCILCVFADDYGIVRLSPDEIRERGNLDVSLANRRRKELIEKNWIIEQPDGSTRLRVWQMAPSLENDLASPSDINKTGVGESPTPK